MISRRLANIGACHDSLKWSKSYKDPKQAWNECVRPDWMVWYMARIDQGGSYTDGHKKLVACYMELTTKIKSGWDNLERETYNLFRSWMNGEKTIHEVDRFYSNHIYWSTYNNCLRPIFWAVRENTRHLAYHLTRGILQRMPGFDNLRNRKKLANIIRKHYPKVPLPKRQRARKAAQP